MCMCVLRDTSTIFCCRSFGVHDTNPYTHVSLLTTLEFCHSFFSSFLALLFGRVRRLVAFAFSSFLFLVAAHLLGPCILHPLGTPARSPRHFIVLLHTQLPIPLDAQVGPPRRIDIRVSVSACVQKQKPSTHGYRAIVVVQGPSPQAVAQLLIFPQDCLQSASKTPLSARQSHAPS
jgi:hypothetical protein